MRRRFLLITVSLAVLAAACGSDSTDEVLSGPAAEIYGDDCVATEGDPITIYSGRSEDLMEPVLDAFRCETGIATEVRWGDSAELALLMQEEGDRTLADVYISTSPGPVGFLESNGLLGTIDQSTLDLVAEANRSDAGTWVGFSGRKRVLVYNLDQVTEAELPESIFDLTDEQYRGRVAIPATNGSFMDWFTVFRANYGDDVATQWLNDMVANDAEYYPNNRAIVEAAGRGEIDMGLVNHYYNYQEVEAVGDEHRARNHDLADDDIGSLLIITTATVTAASDNTEGANRFLQYLLSAPVQEYFGTETLEYPLAAGVEPADVLPPLAAVEAGSVDFGSLGGGFEETTAIIQDSGIVNE